MGNWFIDNDKRSKSRGRRIKRYEKKKIQCTLEQGKFELRQQPFNIRNGESY